MPFKPWQCIEAEEKSVIGMAEQGDALAQYRISWGSSYIEADLVLALRLLHQSARNGFPLSQFDLGNRYLFSKKGVERNFKLAFSLLTDSTHNGHVIAQYNLGRLYRHGLERTRIWSRPLVGFG